MDHTFNSSLIRLSDALDETVHRIQLPLNLRNISVSITRSSAFHKILHINFKSSGKFRIIYCLGDIGRHIKFITISSYTAAV
jgi:hypothetical protein